ncbi:DUF2145 domain-containing protein [Lysobacter sp. LF1]|uniref:DUF2145 domain-containing protein n=1 Tax=Lysobacter stagni TaxID=3045172 RepID=A0ABT6XIP1_9GAMM|nr:DUF2145 domain-containing protein [Lysobacter sp. LF1]MDI9239933.1 DUF2145 domain-containing protein [Lysobacter sp. LF1]
MGKRYWRRSMQGVALALLVTGCITTAAFAAPACGQRYPTPQATQAMFDMAIRVERALDGLDGHDVVLLARGGQDLSRYGLKHSHLALAMREPEGTWRVVHLLNRCRTDRSTLYQEGLANFVGESALHSDVRVGVFEPALSHRLHQWLLAPAARARSLHEPRYSMVAYPFGTQYQNSNQWILEVIAAAAMDPGADTRIDRASVQGWLRGNNYQPSRLHLKLHERIGARFFSDHVAVTDHPAGERIGGDYSVVTVESVFDFLQAKSLLQRDFPVPHPPAEPATQESAP